jgi:hydroxymethylglutaryl-CoA lyase
MTNLVKLIECPRDAWQGLKGIIPADLKTDYLKALISAGFKHIDAVSFVSPDAVPQMADSEEVLKELDRPDDVEIIGVVVNEKGAQRAIHTNAVSTLGFPYSISETFLRRNQNQSPEDSLDQLEKVQKKADDAGLNIVVYISMAFGNPYGDPWSADEVLEAVALLETDRRSRRQGDDQVRLSRNWRASAQPTRTGRGKNSGRLRCRMSPFRFGFRGSGRMSVCAGRAGW